MSNKVVESYFRTQFQHIDFDKPHKEDYNFGYEFSYVRLITLSDKSFLLYFIPQNPSYFCLKLSTFKVFAPFPCILSSYFLITRLVTTPLPTSFFSSYLKRYFKSPRETPPVSASFPEDVCRSGHTALRILKKNLYYINFSLQSLDTR
jgi:hypothetical protein